MQAEHTLVIPYASVSAGQEIPEGTRVVVQAKLLWAGDLLGVAHVRPKDVLRVSDLGLDLAIGDDLVVARGATLVLPGGKEVPRGSRMTLRLGRTMLRVELVADDVVAPPMPKVDRRIALGIIGAAALHVAVMGALHHGRAGEGTIEQTQRVALEHYMAASEARMEADLAAALATAAQETTSGQGGVVASAEGERGTAGNPAQTKTDRLRSTTRGIEVRNDKPNADEVASFGLLALLAADGQRAGTSAFAADTGRSAMGNIFGTAVGDAEGFGALDLTGVGEGGGGKGKGITMTAIGNGTGWGTAGTIGWAGGGRVRGEHQTKASVCMCGTTQVNGRLPPETIQRVVRQNMGRFRACYETALARDPSLEGHVEVKFVIGRSGAVEMASGTGTVPDPHVASCIAKRFEQLSFPEPTGGIVTVVYPFTLTPD